MRKKDLDFHKRKTEDLKDFIKKLELQALETAEERIPLYIEIGLKDADIILDVGCGTGTVTRDIARLTKGIVVAFDGSSDLVYVANSILKDFTNTNLIIGSGNLIPFLDNTFDIVTCNLFFMWVEQPKKVIKEMTRVLRPGGKLLASLEPDYGGKIHWPENKKVDKIFSGLAIKEKGGDPHIGRKLRSLFVGAGLETKVGIGNNRIWDCEEDKSYYLHARDFYVKALKNSGLKDEEIDKWEYEYLKSLDEGIQLNFFPQFYAIGIKPED